MRLKYFPSLPLSREFLVNDYHAKEMVANLHKFGVVRWKDDPFTLKSGIKSNIYVYGRNDLTEHVEALRLVGAILSRVVWDVTRPAIGHSKRVPCAIGIPTAGTAITAAAALDTRWGGFPFRVMREKKKETHGVHKKWVDGDPDPAQHVYVTIDNVTTDGESKKEAADRLAEDGYEVENIKHIVLVDRQQGAIRRLSKQGMVLIPALNLLDVAWAFGETKLWAKSRVKAVEDEIALHQAA